MKAAALAAVITALAAYPRLALWPERRYSILFLWLVLLWSAYVLWSFVFAWYPKYTQQRVISFQVKPLLLLAALLCGLVGTAVCHQFIDPALRVLKPEEFPDDWKARIAMLLFTLVMDPLFFCFAPLAFFIRLLEKRQMAVVMTVVFAVAVIYLRIISMKTPLPHLLAIELLAAKMIVSLLSIHFFLKGGALVVWWWIFWLQSRHLLAN